MKFLKNSFAFIVPLTAMLISFIIYIFSANILENYKKTIANDYSIVIITNTPLIKEKITKLANIKVDKIITLKNENIISNLSSSLSDTSLQLLREKLPNFYKIKLEVFPTTSELEVIKNQLYENKNIRKVEIFSKNHNSIYLLLLLLSQISMILFTIITIFAIIMISKQIRIWFYEHHEKITILKLHGASILYSSSTILRYAIFSALISFVIVSSIFTYLVNDIGAILPNDLINIVTVTLDLNESLLQIFILSFGISILTIIGVLFKYKIKYD
ncbi:cell division protein FtsX [Halarcobacter ebronensis]|uniref:Cell division protein FtsX n=1 Tax=Halarcobacter ebronensis TaxID=1462615 RepID=A0A4Q1AKZ1_9BACT|nr:cell division protein FtsX [Halarcobacter ebronensis]QKF81666.1 cell division protein FtsX [Halarcobacter ebronensis]RXJ68204.1 cell division protein FtsX [Halarcobacter ebronensis]RXK05590.1 cell division protein FtsX [Halarcobacter ebronensis]